MYRLYMQGTYDLERSDNSQCAHNQFFQQPRSSQAKLAPSLNQKGNQSKFLLGHQRASTS
uniref:Uncharacterized protein n=1 Tax=Arundo donax TaxID=35708 RepID=A0A0A9G1B4_ARUDO